MPLRRHQTAKPLGRRLVAERTQGVTRNSHLLIPVAQVLGRILMLPIAVLREILRHLDRLDYVDTSKIAILGVRACDTRE